MDGIGIAQVRSDEAIIRVFIIEVIVHFRGIVYENPDLGLKGSISTRINPDKFTASWIIGKNSYYIFPYIYRL